MKKVQVGPEGHVAFVSFALRSPSNARSRPGPSAGPCLWQGLEWRLETHTAALRVANLTTFAPMRSVPRCRTQRSGEAPRPVRDWALHLWVPGMVSQPGACRAVAGAASELAKARAPLSGGGAPAAGDATRPGARPWPRREPRRANPGAAARRRESCPAGHPARDLPAPVRPTRRAYRPPRRFVRCFGHSRELSLTPAPACRRRSRDSSSSSLARVGTPSRVQPRASSY